MRLKEVRRPAKLLRYRLLAFFAVFGPGLLVALRSGTRPSSVAMTCALA